MKRKEMLNEEPAQHGGQHPYTSTRSSRPPTAAEGMAATDAYLFEKKISLR